MSEFLHHEVLRTVRLTNFTATSERKDWTRGSVYFRIRGTPKTTDPYRDVRKVAEEYRKFLGEFRALLPLRAHAKQIPTRAFTRCWCQSVILRKSSAIFRGRLRTENKRIPRNAERSRRLLTFETLSEFFRNNIILEATLHQLSVLFLARLAFFSWRMD